MTNNLEITMVTVSGTGLVPGAHRAAISVQVVGYSWD